MQGAYDCSQPRARAGTVTNSPLVPRITEACRRWMGSGNPIVFARFCFKQGQTTERQFGCKQVSLPEDEDNVAAGVASNMQLARTTWVRLDPASDFHRILSPAPCAHFGADTVYNGVVPCVPILCPHLLIQARSDNAMAQCVCTGQLPPAKE